MPSESEVPSGVQVQNLKDIAEQQGLPESFAQPWSLPATAVSALPPDASQGTPGMAPATADSPVPALSQPGGRSHQWQCSQAEGLETGNQEEDMAHEHHANSLPSELNAPLLLNAWRRRAMVVGAIFAVLSIVLALLAAAVDHDGINHLLRSYLLGFIICWGFTVGGLALLMVQYLSGGKWGLLLRRPLEAMSRCLPLVIVLFLPIGIFMKKLYLWAQYSNPAEAFQSASDQPRAGARDCLQAPHAEHHQRVDSVRGLLRHLVHLHVPAEQVGPAARCRPASQCSLLAGTPGEPERLRRPRLFHHHDAFAPSTGSCRSTPPGTRRSTGCMFLVGQGYGVLALSIITVLRLSQAEPMHTVLRKTEQHDLGKLAFAFVMLNIYLAFSQFLIIWSGNLPEEIPWYLDRIRGGWGVIASLDFVFHWFIPFTLLLSRDLKRNKERLILVCKFMIFARCWDMFWLIEPNFADARRNLHFSFGILEYMTVPVVVISHLDVVLLRPVAEAAVDPDQRSAPGRDFGGRPCPRMIRTIHQNRN